MGGIWMTVMCIAIFYTAKMQAGAIQDKPGICPDSTDSKVTCLPEMIQNECLSDGKCPDQQKCCPQGCSYVCQNPVTSRDKRRREKRACLSCFGPEPCCYY